MSYQDELVLLNQDHLPLSLQPLEAVVHTLLTPGHQGCTGTVSGLMIAAATPDIADFGQVRLGGQSPIF